MKSALVMTLLAAPAILAGALEFEDIVAKVNSDPASTWVAAVPDRFNSTEDAKSLCGTFLKTDPRHVALPLSELQALDDADIPDSFDSRTAWPKCTVISKVRDQSSCGSCWAFGSTEAFEDRRCVATGADIEFSAEDTASCCSGFACGFSMGCNGGQPSAALSWMASKGVVTGGDYDDVGKGDSCRPYTLKPCAHHVPPSSKYAKCPSSEYPTPQCSQQCESGYSKTYSGDKTRGKNANSYRGVSQIQTAIMTEGPLAVAFTVYADFPTYKSGVYTHKTGGMLGGHAVEMIGWGTENGQDYWLIKNSWNEQWGDGGFFKIARGTDECGIEDDVTGISF